VSVAILFNDVQLNYVPTRRILDAICSELQLRSIDFVEGGLF
jgi:hypothetical protein